LILVVFGAASPAIAKSYDITRVEMEARLMPDGSMEVSEARTYRFEDSFRYAYRDLPAGGPVVFEDFAVSEGGARFRLSDTESPGTFKVERRGSSIRVTWFYRASDESRTFTFTYRARNAVTRHEDAAVLYYKFIAEEWDIPQRNVTLRLKPPEPLPREHINEWLHGPLWAESRILADATILASCQYLPRNTYFEIRALYPTGVFPDAPVRSGEVRRKILTEEAAWADEANRLREAARARAAARRQREAQGRWIAIAAGIAGLIVWWSLYRRYGKRPELPRFLEMTSEIPDDTPPALLSYLLYSRQVAGSALVGTMLDLSRRGFLALREERREVRSIWGGTKPKTFYHWDLNRDHWNRNASDLRDYETILLEFIFNDLAGGVDSVSIEEIKKNRRACVRFFRSWRKTVEAAGKQRLWYEPDSMRGMYYSLLLGGVMTGGGMLLVFLMGPWGLILCGAGGVVLGLSLLIVHRTAEGETKARHWRAVQKYLKSYEFRGADRRTLLSQISDYLVYRVVLGLSSKLYEELAAYIPEGAHGTYVPWYLYAGTRPGGFSSAAFAEAFSSMVATTTSTMSTASGAGGGASAGGGGGASSGGGGAG
jgi:hypothetical protein